MKSRRESLVSADPFRESTYELWNRARGSVLIQRGERSLVTLGIGVRGGGAVMAALPFALARAGVGGLSFSGGGEAFAVSGRVLQFPTTVNESGELVDADWLNGAELVTLKTRYAGLLTRTVTDDAFTIPATATR